MRINSNQLQEVAGILIRGYREANNYNRECFGMFDLYLASQTSIALDEFFKALENAGYNPEAVLKQTLEEENIYFKRTFSESLKKTIEPDFMMDFNFTGVDRILQYCKIVTKRKVAAP